MKTDKQEKSTGFRPDHVTDYFRMEGKILAAITVTGLIYNVGLMAGPWFEGKMAGCLLEILQGKSGAKFMAVLALAYLITISLVQGARFFKRFYVRRFANEINRKMKGILYQTLVHRSKRELEAEDAGTILTKAISDADDCTEGMRKFTTEIFDTGVAMAGYVGMLLVYDRRLAVGCLIFPLISYILAEKMKKVVQRTGTDYKKETGKLSQATLDLSENALLYRVFGCENQCKKRYEKHLKEYEIAAVKANIWNTALPPIYRVVSMAGCMPILYFGIRNVLGCGWTDWDLAAFTTFLSCYTKLAEKSSKAAKLFNAVHKAGVSWNRILPYLQEASRKTEEKEHQSCAEKNNRIGLAGHKITAENLSFSYPDGPPIFENLSFTANTGEIVGITGPVACGKSTLGKMFLSEFPYKGHLKYGGQEISELSDAERSHLIGYLGHDPELFNDTVENNVLYGTEDDVGKWLKKVCLWDEVKQMEQQEETMVGNDGTRLSGGQAKRLALARTLCHAKSVLILDDPFSALDRKTEEQIFEQLKGMAKDRIIFLISHRLSIFPQMNRVIWLDGGKGTVASHETLIKEVADYRNLYLAQKGEPVPAIDSQ